MFDVIVIGAGPGGSVAGKRCAEQGLKTLILEKKKLPRDKVCSGMLLSRMAKILVEEEFGELPKEILLANLSGLILWMPDVGEHKITVDIPITWRKDLDYWMNQTAKDRGVEIWENVLVKKVIDNGVKCRIYMRKGGVEDELESRFVVGADGAYSITRNSLFPEFQITYTTAQRECYQGSLNLQKDYSYIVFPNQQYRPNFWINPKGDCFTLEGGLRELKDEVRNILMNYGLKEQKLLWKDGCINRALLHMYFSSGRFVPAKGNVLLVGDAGGLKNPINGEGIHTALKSGILAAESITESIKKEKKVSEVYLDKIQPLLADLALNYTKVEKIKAQLNRGIKTLSALIEVFEESIESINL
ncbi:MAG: NAD(P)/FAD-dependent oxidoreductase [Thermodesulfobacteriota bacterium]